MPNVGKRLFRDKPCSTCHRSAARAAVSDPRPPDERRALKTMSGGEMADLVAYLRSLRRSR